MMKCSKWFVRVSVGLLSMVAASCDRDKMAMGDLIINIQSGSIGPNDTAVVDVFIRSTGTDPLRFANYEFAITPVDPTPNPSGSLRFADLEDQPNPNVQANYVFFTDLTPGNAAVEPLGPHFITAFGGDATGSGSDFDVTGSSLLLTRLRLLHITPTPLAAIGTYRISLVNNPDNTFFKSANANPLNIDPSSFSVANSGLLTITAVPEPSAVMLLSLASAVWIGARRFRRMRSA